MRLLSPNPADVIFVTSITSSAFAGFLYFGNYAGIKYLTNEISAAEKENLLD